MPRNNDISPIGKELIEFGGRRDLRLHERKAEPRHYTIPQLFSLLLQIHVQKFHRPLPGIGGIVHAIATLVVGILKGMAGVGIDRDIYLFAQRFHLALKFLYVVRSNPFVLSSEKPKDGRVDF